jgi:hypothetical protein
MQKKFTTLPITNIKIVRGLEYVFRRRKHPTTCPFIKINASDKNKPIKTSQPDGLIHTPHHSHLLSSRGNLIFVSNYRD